MKKSLMIVAILIVALAGTSVFAQTSATASVGAVVKTALSIAKTTDINFGNIQATSSPVLDAQATNTADVGTSHTFGQFTISGATGATISLTYDATAALANGATGSMTFTADVSTNTSDAIATSTDRASGATPALDGTSGDLYLYVGGNLGSLSSQETGTYSAGTPWSFSVEYN